MDPSTQSQAEPSTLRTVVTAGSQLLLELPTGKTHKVTIPAQATMDSKQNINLPKIGSVRVGELIGKRFGLQFNLLGDGRMELMEQEVVVAPELTDATNEGIRYDAGAQTLTTEDILEMKRAGVSGEDIVARQIESHSQFALKNEFSKSKYIAKKEAKFLKYIKLMPPTTFNVASHVFYEVQHDTRKNPWPRPDTLGQLLLQANVRPADDCRILLAEDGSGLLTGSILSLLGGHGRLLLLNEFDSPPSLQHLPLFQLSQKEQEPLRWLNWLQARPDYDGAASDSDDGKMNEKQKARRKKRQDEIEARNRIREDLHAGDWQSLVIVANLDPMSVIDELLPYLAGSASIVVYSEYQQPLVQLCEALSSRPEFLAPTLTEPHLRQYQVLPGRMHPEMNGLPGAGYILHTYRILVGPEPDVATLPKRKKQRR